MLTDGSSEETPRTGNNVVLAAPASEDTDSSGSVAMLTRQSCLKPEIFFSTSIAELFTDTLDYSMRVYTRIVTF